jgi:superfamily II DNA or RNA helicase
VNQPIVRKPSWLGRQAFEDLLNRYGGAPRCEKTGETEELTIDHIVPRWAGGTDDISNLQFLAARINVKKGIHPDTHWSQNFYWDSLPNLNGLRGAQRLLFEEILDRSGWFGRPLSEIARHLYLNAWVVGAGKTLGIAVAAWAVNHVIQERWGAARRADQVLVVAKERAVRDQIAKDLAEDIPRYGILARPPQVAVIERGWQFGQTEWIKQHDIVVTCVQQLWERDGSTRSDQALTEILARFPTIAFDEPHFAPDRVSRLVDMASSSVCFGFTGTPIDGAGRLLERMVALTVYGYDQANRIDRGLKWLDNSPSILGRFVREIGITEAGIIERGERTTTDDVTKDGYDKNIEPAKTVVRAVIDEMKRRDELIIAEEDIAPHRDRSTAVLAGTYPSHGIIVCDNIRTADALYRNTDDMFGTDPVAYPRTDGWRSEIVHTETDDGNGKRLRGKPLTTDHPWLRAKGQGYRMDAKCARLLFVVGIGREGVNNPPCGPIGIATSQESVVEVVQRAIGRQLRAVVATASDGKLHVPPAPLDTVLIITHEAFNNTEVIKRAIDFVCEMERHLGDLPSIDDLDSGDLPSLPDVDRSIKLPVKEKLQIAGRLGEPTEQGQPRSVEDVVTEFAGICASTPIGDRIRDWATKVRKDPEAAREEIHLHVRIKPCLIVTREDIRHNPSDADLERHLKVHHPNLAGRHIPIKSENRDIVEALYVEHARRFYLPPLVPHEHVSTICRRLGGRVLNHLGRHFLGDTTDAYRLATGAVKQKLGVPNETLRDGSDWDTAQVHALLQRPDVQNEIFSWVTARLIDSGSCPALAALRAGASA